jgi:hypothetical protein
VRWLSTGRLLDGVLYAVLASASVYVHFLFGIMFLVHVAFLVYHRSAAGQVDPKRVCFIALLVALLLTPLTPLFLRLVTRRQLLSFADNPSLRDAVVPSMLLVSLLFGLLFGRVFAKLKFSRESHVRAKNPGFLLLCWMLVPPLLLLAITLLTSTKLFSPRYYLPAVPALSLLCAWGIRMMEPPLARRIIATTLAIVFIGCFMQREKYDDWRRATASARLETEGSSTPVLVRSGLIESTQMDWVLEPEKASYLLAPLAFYPVGGSAFALPYDDSDPVARQYVDQLAQRVLNDSNRFILIARAGSSEAPFKELLETLGRPLGFHAQYVKSFGIIVVVVFEREFKLD